MNVLVMGSRIIGQMLAQAEVLIDMRHHTRVEPSQFRPREHTQQIDALLSGDQRTIEVRDDVAAAYQDRYQKEIDSLVWSSPAIKSSFYKGADGKIHMLSPWPLGD